MALVFRSRFFRGFLAFVLMGAGLFVGWVEVALLVEVVTGKGNSEGNTLILDLGLVLFMLSAFLLVIGIINWRRLSRPFTDEATLCDMSHFEETKGAFQVPDLASAIIADALLEERVPRPHNFFPTPDNRIIGMWFSGLPYLQGDRKQHWYRRSCSPSVSDD